MSKPWSKKKYQKFKRWVFGITAVILICIGIAYIRDVQNDAAPVAITTTARPTAKPAAKPTAKPTARPADKIPTEWTPDSTCFSEIGYDANTETLVVVFRESNSKYAYYNVPEYIWEEFSTEKSLGGYFNREIKGSYDYERLS